MRAAAGLALLLGLAVAGPSAAGEQAHTVAPGETLADIARLYYGDSGRADVIRFHNHLASAEIRVGAELRVPVADEHRVAPGETWSGLAEQYWRDGGLHQELARMSTGSPEAPLRTGRRILIPPLISYRLELGDTLAGVSRRFYGHPGEAGMLARLNGIRDPRRLRVGTSLRIPLSGLGPPPTLPAAPAQEPDAPQVSAPPPERKPPEQAGFAVPLRRAINAYLDGRYQQALDRLEELRPRVLASAEPDEQALLLRHLIFVYAAFERPEPLCESYRALLALQPDLTWDPDEVSPKILGLAAACKRR